MCSCEHGTCSNGYCVCDPRWIGENCQISTEIEARVPFFIAHRVIFAVTYWVLLTHVGWHLALVFRARYHQADPNLKRSMTVSKICLSTQIICLWLLLASCVIRAFFYSLDPHCWVGIIVWQAAGLLLDVPVMLILVAFCVNLIVWMKMQIQFAASSTDFSLRFVSVQPSILKVIILLFPLAVLMEEILYAVGAMSYTVSLIIYNFSTALTILYVIVSAMYFGGKIMSYLKHTSASSNSTSASRGLLNMTKIVVGGSVNGAIAAALLIIATIVGCGSLRPGNCQPMYQTLFRIPEIIIVLLMASAVTSTNTVTSNNGRKMGNVSGKQTLGGGVSSKRKSQNTKTNQNHSKSHKSHKSQLSFGGQSAAGELTITRDHQKDEKYISIDTVAQSRRKNGDPITVFPPEKLPA